MDIIKFQNERNFHIKHELTKVLMYDVGLLLSGFNSHKSELIRTKIRYFKTHCLSNIWSKLKLIIEFNHTLTKFSYWQVTHTHYIKYYNYLVAALEKLLKVLQEKKILCEFRCNFLSFEFMLVISYSFFVTRLLTFSTKKLEMVSTRFLSFHWTS